MTVAEYLKQNTKLLREQGIPSARLDCLILMEHVTGIDRANLLADGDKKLSVKHINVLNKLVEKRATHIPITQLINNCEFYGRNFYVNEFVMAPRPETEKMIEVFLDLYKAHKVLKPHTKLAIADVGCGSGVIGITLKMELPNLDIDLIDIDRKALRIAQINVVLHTISINTILNDLITQLDRQYHVILANLPYVPDKFAINEEAMTEPKIALFGGPDGLKVYRKLFSNIKRMQNKPLLILTESFPLSHKDLKDVALGTGYKEIHNEDFIQAFELKQKASI